ncbi:MAG: hypothetical protein NT018_03305 [Armatimonadetes bacterium]|nr:hypothetical protein [Armatimonadota bacterium]
MPKLYKVRTHGEMLARPDRIVGYDDVTIHWFREGRTEPAYPYTWMVPGWEDMALSLDPQEHNPIYARKLAAYVDQLFTQEEALALREYFISTRRVNVEVEEIEIPLTNFEIPFRLIPPEPQAGEEYGFIQLATGPNRPLPFAVTGYFDMEYQTAYERYQMAAVKSLMVSSGLTLMDESKPDNDLQQLCDKLNSLRLALMRLAQSLNQINRNTHADGKE